MAFLILFSGVVSSVLAGATTALLLAFVLPVSLPGTVASIPDRLEGWCLAGVASLVAIAVLWPAPERHPIRDGAAAACRALAARLRAQVEYWTTPPSHDGEAGLQAVIDEADQSVAALHDLFYASPVPADRAHLLRPGGDPPGRRAALAQRRRAALRSAPSPGQPG